MKSESIVDFDSDGEVEDVNDESIMYKAVSTIGG